MVDYKQEIQSTRKGCLGSSDGALLANVANLGFVPKSAYKRLAVCKGLIEQTEIPKTTAMRSGDYIEQEIFSLLSQGNEKYESNPLWVSKRYSKNNVSLISHPDIVLQDDAKKVLYVYEVKTTKFDVEYTKLLYRPQLFIHKLLAKERVQELGGRWKVKVLLVHYSTEGLNLEEGVDFDADRLTISECKFKADVLNVSGAMDIINVFLEDFDYYAEDDEVDAELLPERVKKEFDAITNVLSEIKEREIKVNEFKQRLYEFMLDKGVKSIKSETFNITRVDETESRTFDYKRYLEDYSAKHPQLARKIQKQYEKISKRKGYATIKLKNQ